MSRFSILEGKARLYNDTAEAWKGDHVEAMLACDIDDLIALGVDIFDRIEHRLHHQERIDFETADVIYRTAKIWLTATFVIEKLIEWAVSKNYDIEGADELRKRTAVVTGMMPELEHMQRALAEVRGGKGLTVKEAIRVLRSNRGPVGSPAA